MNELTTEIRPTKSGKENPRRGANYRQFAIMFRRKYPIDSTLTWEAFSEWANAVGMASFDIPDDVDKQSDEWLAYLQRRNYARINLNKAANHSSMQTGGGAYIVDVLSPNAGMLVVRSVISSLAESSAARKVESLAKTKKRQLEYLIASADWSVLPVEERVIAEALYDDIEFFTTGVERSAEHLERKFNKLRSRIESLKNRGDIQTRNGAITRMLTDES